MDDVTIPSGFEFLVVDDTRHEFPNKLIFDHGEVAMVSEIVFSDPGPRVLNGKKIDSHWLRKIDYDGTLEEGMYYFSDGVGYNVYRLEEVDEEENTVVEKRLGLSIDILDEDIAYENGDSIEETIEERDYSDVHERLENGRYYQLRPMEE